MRNGKPKLPDNGDLVPELCQRTFLLQILPSEFQVAAPQLRLHLKALQLPTYLTARKGTLCQATNPSPLNGMIAWDGQLNTGFKKIRAHKLEA